MTEKHLVFNGVNGRSGTYGLAPRTAEDLADHILHARDPEAKGQPDVQRWPDVQRRLQSDAPQKISAIVRLLAENSLDPGERDAAWQREWLAELARTLAGSLLGDEYTSPGQVEALGARLRSHTVEKLATIARLLAEGDAPRLERWLLEDQDEAEEDTPALKEQLKRQAQGQFDALRAGPLAPERAPGLEADAALHGPWLDALLSELYLVPIDALNALPEVKVRLEPAVALLKELDTTAGTPSPAWAALHREMEPLSSRRGVSWDKLLRALRRGLEVAIAEPGRALPWAKLLAALDRWLQALRQPLRDMAVVEGVDPADLAQAGWGVIFPREDPRQPGRVAAIKEQLRPLLDLRREQAGQHFRIFEDGKGYWPNDTARSFLAGHGATPDQPVDPNKVPYYLLLVGSPEEIPFHFQYQLDVQYAVGRLDFGDDLEAYGHYARGVVAAEQGELDLPRRAAFFATSNPGDTMTRLSAEHLVRPLQERLQARYGPGWTFATALGEEATRPRLAGLLGGEETPALLFAACHGLEFDREVGRDHQETYQGALVCQEWAGPAAGRGPVPRDAYLAGEDLDEAADLGGTIAFLFACYGAGTPRFDEFYKQAFKERGETIAERPFLAALPRAMLSRPRGAALAVVAHVERVWGTSFLDDHDQQQIAVFQSAVERLLRGQPVGLAMEYLNGRYAALSTELNQAIQDHQDFGRRIDPYELARLWTGNNDARGYVVLGDPAVRLPVATPGEGEPA